MEAGTSRQVSGSNAAGLTYLQALKVVAAPLATITAVAGTIVFFAADAYIRVVVNEEVAALVTGNSNASTLLTEHGQRIETAERDIAGNEDDIEKVDDKFTEFVREVIAKL